MWEEPAARECALGAETGTMGGSSVNVPPSFEGSRSWFLYFDGAKRLRDIVGEGEGQ